MCGFLPLFLRNRLQQKKEGFPIKNRMLKMLSAAVSAVLLLLLMVSAAPLTASAAKAKPVRRIHLVYDDSRSMINDTAYTDRWCQAKYALEVFAAMLDENDTMNVYVMSDFYLPAAGYNAVPPRLQLSGSAPPADNVRQVHGMETAASGTPFETVERAYSDLAAASADEKWLVVLTDGEFSSQSVSNMNTAYVNSFFQRKDAAVSVMYLAIGSGVQSIEGNDAQNIYSYSAVSNTDILGRLTEMSNRIFERNRLEVDPANGKISFDIPMRELIVFAQGANVEINGIKAPDGSVIRSDQEPVEVRYSETAAKNYKEDPNVIVNRNLVGKVAYFNGDFAAGDYTADVSGASTIDIYYRPNVDIAVHLVNSEGTRLSTSDPIPEGTYTLEYGFVKPGTEEFLPESKLLGEVDYSATAAINGIPDGKTYKNGDSIDVKEGSLDIEATAEYLIYNTVSASLHYDVFQDKPLVISLDDSVVYELDENGFVNGSSPMRLTVALKDRPLTQAEWDILETPKLGFVLTDEKLGKLKIVKTDTIGEFDIFPTVYQDDPMQNAVGNFTFHVSLQQKVGMDVWSGQTDGVLHIHDGISFFKRHPWVPWAILSLLLLLLLFLIWITRKVLPKSIRIVPGSTRFFVSPNPMALEGLEATCAYKRKRKRLEISSPPYEQNYEAVCSVTFDLKPVDRRYVKSKRRRFAITGIHTQGSVFSVNINGAGFERDAQGNWVPEGTAGDGTAAKVSGVFRNPSVEMMTGSPANTISRCECQLNHY